jgi:hypothetical protein
MRLLFHRPRRIRDDAARRPARPRGRRGHLEILGFSADGGVFAFEQYGVQDGSGFPYAERFYIDVDNDSWLPGTPIRVRIDDETASVEDARQEARDQGQGHFRRRAGRPSRRHGRHEPGDGIFGRPAPHGGQPAPMIPRYSRPEMAAIWSPETKFRIWFEIEAHACDALAELGVIPKEAAKTIWEKGGPAPSTSSASTRSSARPSTTSSPS